MGSDESIMLAYFLTLMPLKVDGDAVDDCGLCRRCIAVCPAGAIGENSRNSDLEAYYQQLRRFCKKDNLGQHICGICLKACLGREKLKV